MILDRDASILGLLERTGIQQFLDDKRNTEIAINRPFELWTEDRNGWHKHDMPHLDYATLYRLANNFAIFNKLEINAKNPICSGVLPDGQRGQVVVPSAVEADTVSFTIRQPSLERYSLADYAGSGRLDRWVDKSDFLPKNTILPSHLADKIQAQAKEIAYLNDLLGIPKDVHLQLFELKMLLAKAERNTEEFIRLGVKHRQNFCLVGATGSGKTTFTKAICDVVPTDTRIITIEDTAELDLPNHPNRVHMFYKDVSPKDILRSLMRMKPDRIFLTELRGDEAFDYLNTLNTGHGGSVTTVHANDCQSAYSRIGTLVQQSEVGQTMSMEQIMHGVYKTIDVMMFLNKTVVKEVMYDPIRKYRNLRG